MLLMMLKISSGLDVARGTYDRDAALSRENDGPIHNSLTSLSRLLSSKFLKPIGRRELRDFVWNKLQDEKISDDFIVKRKWQPRGKRLQEY